MYKLIKLIAIIGVAAAFNSCSYLPQFAPLISYIPSVLDFSGPNLTTIEIESTKTTNCGTPFYVLVKKTDFSNFLIDDYQKVAGFIVNPPLDQSSFVIVCVVPGINQIIEMETPENKSLAVYCLFTNPGGVWKHIFELEEDCANIRIVLGENEIISVEK